MVSFDHIHVQVKCRAEAASEIEQVATEYEDEECPDEGSLICRYIEVQANQYWKVKATIGRHFDWQNADLVTVRLYLDGKYTAGQCLSRPALPASVKARLKGTFSGDSKYLLFKFADLETRELHIHRRRTN